MGLLFKPNIKRALAGAEVKFGEDAASVTWHGYLGTLVRGHSIYLDWAVNKDNRAPALAFLASILDFLDQGPPDRFATPASASGAWRHSIKPVEATGTATIAFSDQMRCKGAFRPRTAIVKYLYPTFWALWNQLVLRASDEPGAIEAFVDDLRTQIDYYDKKGIGMRGGIAPIFAARVGAGARLAEEIAEFHGLTLAEFRALPETERHRLTDEHTDNHLRQAGLLNEGQEPPGSEDGGLIKGDFGLQILDQWRSLDDDDPDAERRAQLQDQVTLDIINEILDNVGERWDELYAKDQNPTLADPDLNQVLVWLRTLTADNPNEGLALNDDALSAVWSLGSAGYCWRLAEEQCRDGPDEEYLEEIERVMADLPDEPPREQVSRDRIFTWGAGECANLGQSGDFRVWEGCPVGFAFQFDFFRAAFDRLTEIIIPAGVEVTKADLLYAFTFGLALRDVERWLDQHPT